MGKKIFRQLTPFFIVAIAAFVFGLYYLVFKSVNINLQIFGLAFLLLLSLLLAADYLLKKFTKFSLLKLWIVQLVLLVIAVYVWVVQ